MHAQNAVARFWAAQKQHGHVNFANWPLYIDTGRKTLQEFTATTGITVSYAEVIQEDDYWVNKIAPILRAGESIGYDLMVVTNGFWFSELLTMGGLIPLDQSMLPNFRKYAAAKFQHRSFDPGNTYSIPWASGTTGIAWNPKFIQTPVTSLKELWNPAYKGRVGMMADIQDLGNFGLLKLGVNPETSTPARLAGRGEDAHPAARRGAGPRLLPAVLHRRADQREHLDLDGLVRGHLPAEPELGDGPEVRHPGRGRHAVDRQHDDPQVRPEPRGRHDADGLVLPAEIAAQLTESINYISAVPAAQPIIARDAARASGSSRRLLHEVATSELVWPTPADYKRLFSYADVSGKLQAQYEAAFNPVIHG